MLTKAYQNVHVEHILFKPMNWLKPLQVSTRSCRNPVMHEL